MRSLVTRLPTPLRRGLGLRIPVEHLGAAFTDGRARPSLVQALSLDPRHANRLDAIARGLDRARERGEFLHLYAHDIGHHTGPWVLDPARLGALLGAARERDLPVLSYRDWLESTDRRAGVVLSFDDDFTDHWCAHRALLERTGATATFFVCRPQALSAEQWADLAILAAAGHEIGCHGAVHVRADRFLREASVERWLDVEVRPAVDAFAERGWSCASFAYPYGARTAATDAALGTRFRLVRATTYTR